MVGLMKAVLDHIGIAVRDVGAALAFYRDALGLDIEPPEDVAAQRVRAHFIRVGEPSLELLEPTAGDSPIAKYLEKRGPGLHHITLRVENLAAALAHVKQKGVRLIDEQPRPGAEGSLVAFVHPAGAHGVLVELKQSAAASGVASGVRLPLTPPLSVNRYTIGDLELISLYDGFFSLDGGGMFGIVPRAVWSARMPPDDQNRVRLAMRPLVVRGVRTMLIDAGMGDNTDEKFNAAFQVERARNLDHALAEAGLAVEDIDLVLATHLHFDHAGGFLRRDANGRLRPRFPRARYVVRRGEWEDATHLHARNRASYLPDTLTPLADAGVLEMVDDDQTIMPGVKVRRTGGHTMHHQIVLIESGRAQAVYMADLLPTVAHLPEAWITGFDLYPMDSYESKRQFLREAVAARPLVFFDHDPHVAAGYIVEENGKRKVRASPEASRTE
jgi:methylmalonyl-CoA epimerase